MNLNEQVKSVILSNLRPAAGRRVGVEIECLVYDRNMNRIPVNRGNRFSATDLLARLSSWQSEYEQCIHYSLEPGGQLEYASPPVCSLHNVHKQYHLHMDQLLRIADEENLVLVDYSLDPLNEPEAVELINQDKYRLMNEHFSKTGGHGLWMMRNTTSVQINIDLASEREAEEMAFIADCLQPLAAVLFANAPFKNRQPAGNKNLRYQVWSDTDPARCGNLLDHGIDSPDGLLDKYIAWILTTPMIFATDSQGLAIPFRGSAGEWLRSTARDGSVSAANIQTVLHQIFTHVRFKHVLEVRGADRPLCNHEMAPTAFWLGLLAIDSVREKALDLVQSWSTDFRIKLEGMAANLDINQKLPDNRKFSELIGQVCDLALAGLDARVGGCNVENETDFLADYLEFFFKHGPPSLYIQEDFRKSSQPLSEFVKNCAIAYE